MKKYILIVLAIISICLAGSPPTIEYFLFSSLYPAEGVSGEVVRLSGIARFMVMTLLAWFSSKLLVYSDVWSARRCLEGKKKVGVLLMSTILLVFFVNIHIVLMISSKEKGLDTYTYGEQMTSFTDYCKANGGEPDGRICTYNQ